MNKKSIKEDIIMVTVISFIGFCFEELWMLINFSVLDNRNMFLPFLLGYGLFVVLLYYLIGLPNNIFNKYDFGSLKNVLLYFLLSFLLVSIGEILLGTFVEKTGNFYYWNYINIPMHVTRYTSVPTSLGFALVITIFMNHMYLPLLNKVKKVSKKIPTFIVIFIFLLLIMDLNVSFKNMYHNKGNNNVWKIEFKK